MNSEGQRVLDDVMKYKDWTGNAVDGGAHIGVWTKAMAEIFDHIYAYEPNPDTGKKLMVNVNAFPRVKFRQKALGWVGKNKVRMMWRHVGKDDTTRVSSSGEEAEVTTLDLEDVRNVSFIKLDLEGFEYFALRGAERTIRDNRPVILIEEKDHLPQYYGVPLKAAREWLESIGMIVVREYKIDVLMDWP